MAPAEADKLGVSEDERRFHIRADNAKLNLAPPPKDAVWLKLNSVDLPNGDKVQAVTRWEAPSPWGDLIWPLIDRILTRIDVGPGDDEFYSYSKQSKDRWAGLVVVEEACKTEGQAVSILKAWKESGVLEEDQYASPRQKGAKAGCVRVNQAKLSEMRRAYSRPDSADE
jgi:hypothetical protein